jgi:hypothetical protein
MDKHSLRPDSWVLHRFPDAAPAEIVRHGSRANLDLDEYQRAVWLWRRRPSEVRMMVYLLIFGIGGLIHIPLILGDDWVIFAIYHTFYVGVVGACIGRFLWIESRYRRWRQDYLGSLARLKDACESEELR